MVYLISGQDNFSSWFHFKKLARYYQEKYSGKVNFYYFSFEEDSFNEKLIEFKNTLKNDNLFTSEKIILTKNLFSFLNGKEIKEILKIFENNFLNSKNIAIIYEKEEPQKEIIDWFIRKKQKIKFFKKLNRNQFKDLAKKLASKFQFQISQLALDLLTDAFYPNTWLLYQTIKKLSLVNKKFIDNKILKENVYLLDQPYIFDFLDALLSNNPEEAFFSLEKIKKESTYHPLVILKMLEKQIRNLIIIKKMKELKIRKIKTFSLSPFAFKKLSYLSSFLNLLKLKEIYGLLSLYDRKIKEGSLDAELSIDLLLLNIFSKNNVSLSNIRPFSRHQIKNRG